MLFSLDPDLDYLVILHDPTYLVVTSNPLVFPRVWLGSPGPAANRAGAFLWLYLSVTERRLLDREGR